jgi:phospholipid transport system substrate-binding protein
MAVLLALLVVLLVPSAALADPPPRPPSATDELRRSFDEIMTMAQSAKFRALDAGERREAVRKVADRVFNWSEIAKRALGTHWRDGNARQRRTFSDWFAALAERAYTGSIAQLTTRDIPPDAIKYLGEIQRGGETVVRTVLMYPRELPLDFVMAKRASRWEVCDVYVDGVSAVENYRAQFARILNGGGSFPALVDRMNAKTASGAASPRTPE